jgi:hypothetical protein
VASQRRNPMPEVTVVFESLQSVKTVVLQDNSGNTIVLPDSTDSEIIIGDTTVILPDNGIGTVVIPDQNPGIVVLDDSGVAAPTPPQPVILPPSGNTVVLAQGGGVVLLTSDAPGPPGPQGPPGPSAGQTVTRIAARALSGERVVKAVAGDAVDYASADQLADAFIIEGITTTAADSGTTIEVQAAGEMFSDTWSWSLGPVYCGLDGKLTQTPPQAAWIRQVATAVDTGRIIVNLLPPIVTA